MVLPGDRRAESFSDSDPDAQATMIQRLRKGPPRRFWTRKVEAGKVNAAKRNLAALELRRVEIADGEGEQRGRNSHGQVPDEDEARGVVVGLGFRRKDVTE